ncbi:sphingomyelin phosphodiesterase [Saccharopolyspora sp. NPDC002686]|uniref:sphingomyelin phosphodiesterase n=1 Tax=Saccharopolyspora sp. NPDC002686 TaxID=3154541 RepID=UPI0033348BA3
MKIRIAFTSLVVAVSGLAAPTAVAGPAADGPRIASYNVFMLPRSLYPNWGQLQRADLIASEGVLSGQDVVVVQEAFDNEASQRLLANLAEDYPNQTPVLGRSRDGWDATLGSYSDTRPEDGGVAVLSRWPVAERIQYVFPPGCGADAASNKGFAYTRIDSPSGPVHVIGTHLQADDPACGDRAPGVRADQLGEIAQFVRDKAIPAAEPVVVAGDLNVDASAGEFTSALATLGAAAPQTTGHPYSYDPATNSVAADQAPGAPGQLLDHVLPLTGHGSQQWVDETRAVHSPEWSVTSWGQTYTYTDFSDHYPVFASPS